MSTTSAVSKATSVPAPPMAMPTVALASAGASFTPSPTIAVGPYLRSRRSTATTLSSGSRSAMNSSTPTWAAMLAATRSLSPVSITTRAPRALSCATASRAPGRRVSATAMRASQRRASGS